MDIRDKFSFTLKVLFLAALLGAIIWADVTSQMSFTENTRAGIYEASYQRQQKGGPP